MDGMYGKGKYCCSEDDCIGLVEMSFVMVIECDVDLLLEYWEGWCEVFVVMKLFYVE